MLRKVNILTAGDTKFVDGELVELVQVIGRERRNVFQREIRSDL